MPLMEAQNILLARQPIYDKQLNVHAYELLFRPPNQSNWEWDGDIATSQLVVNAFTEIGIEKVVNHKTAFINFTQKWLESPPPFDARYVTIEVLEDVDPNEEIIAGVKALADRGFTIALDDFVYHEKWKPLLEIAHIIKIDVLNLRRNELETTLEQLKPYNVKLLAEKIEDHEMFELCKQLGFEFFQGYFLSKPQNIHGEVMPSNKVVIMSLLAELQNPNATVDGLEKIISNDISLSTKILRICNSAEMAVVKKIDTIRRAVVLIGLQALKQWSSIIALSRLSDKPSELVCLTLQRAKMMEYLANASNIENKAIFFTVGMFSLVDAFFDRPIKSLLKNLPFDDTVNGALLNYEGDVGKVLFCVQAQEKGNWLDIDWPYLNSIDIDEEAFEKAYLDAIIWSTEVMQSLIDNH